MSHMKVGFDYLCGLYCNKGLYIIILIYINNCSFVILNVITMINE